MNDPEREVATKLEHAEAEFEAATQYLAVCRKEVVRLWRHKKALATARARVERRYQATAPAVAPDVGSLFPPTVPTEQGEHLARAVAEAAPAPVDNGVTNYDMAADADEESLDAALHRELTTFASHNRKTVQGARLAVAMGLPGTEGPAVLDRATRLGYAVHGEQIDTTRGDVK